MRDYLIWAGERLIKLYPEMTLEEAMDYLMTTDNDKIPYDFRLGYYAKHVFNK